MLLNADFSKKAIVSADELKWVASPIAGVERQMFERIGDEVARATSIVRYAPNSHFAPHTHDGGEEFLVLSGVFQDEHGDYPAGSYVRNPPTTRHTPGSEPGCIIFVKLHQFNLDDRTSVVLHSNEQVNLPDDGSSNSSHVVLFSDDSETVQLDLLGKGAAVTIGDKHRFEALVVAGSIEAQGQTLNQHSWIRLPADEFIKVTAGPEGAHLWTKRGHATNTTPFIAE